MSSYIYQEPSLKYKILTTSILIFLILLIILGSFLIAPKIGYLLFYVTIFIVIALIIFLHSTNTAYQCKACNHEFEISFWKDLITAHSPGKILLKCPKCSYRDYASELVKIRVKQE